MDPIEELNIPQPGPLMHPDPTSAGIFNTDPAGNWLAEDPLYDWTPPTDFSQLATDQTSFEWSYGADPAGSGFYEVQPQFAQQQFQQQDETAESLNPPLELPDSVLRERGFRDVGGWLGGAYCPPFPCSYCRQHRLQCLILRTTSANPNPVTSCSSCVALFRECSLARGEKREPSGFETLSPVLGHLHGVTEQMEDGV